MKKILKTKLIYYGTKYICFRKKHGTKLIYYVEEKIKKPWNKFNIPRNKLRLFWNKVNNFVLIFFHSRTNWKVLWNNIRNAPDHFLLFRIIFKISWNKIHLFAYMLHENMFVLEQIKLSVEKNEKWHGTILFKSHRRKHNIHQKNLLSPRIKLKRCTRPCYTLCWNLTYKLI